MRPKIESVADPQTSSVESPCCGVCQLNAAQICTGCFRSIDEIIDWSTADHDRRMAILRAVADRRGSNIS